MIYLIPRSLNVLHNFLFGLFFYLLLSSCVSCSSVTVLLSASILSIMSVTAAA